jgi:hypothetical protein
VNAGYSLVEAVIALVLGVLLCAVLAAVLATGQRAAAAYAAAVDRVEARRVAVLVVGGDVRPLLPDEDLAVESGTLLLRAMRGVAITCGIEEGTLLVRYRGVREPDPGKDSLVVVRSDGDAVVPLEASTRVAPGPCLSSPEEQLYRWRAGDAAPGGSTLLLLFEHGSYHLSGGALRYRRGEGGRQPLTPEVFRDGASRFEAGPGWIGLHLADGEAAGRPPFRAHLAVPNGRAAAGPRTAP